MKIKQFIITFFGVIFFFLFTTKINAASINYCNYNSELKLMLPVTIGVEVSGINTFYPFDIRYNVNYQDQLFVYDKTTCNSYLDIGNFSSKEYYLSYSYYYSYNDNKTYVDYIGGGTFTHLDKTAPKLYSLLDTLTLNVNEYNELDEIIDFIIANDETDGRIIPEIIYDSYSDNYNILGEYSILFRACDKSNNCSTYNQKIKVIDTTSPTITGPTFIQTLMSNPINLNDVAKKLVAIDNYDGNISNKIFLDSTNYNFSSPNIYYAYFYTEDSSLNFSLFKIEIEVIDDIPPLIEGPTLFESKLSSSLQLNTILANMIVYDNVDISSVKNIYIINDQFSNNKEKPGTYKIIIGCYDVYGNESIPYKVEVKVIDDIPPSIGGKSLYKSYLSTPLTLLEIKNNLIAFDNIDGNMFNKIEILEDTYSLNKNNIGTFYIIFTITDSSNNLSDPFIVEIESYDDIAPLIKGETSYIVTTIEKLDSISIKLSLSANDNIDGDISNKIILNENTYSNNENIVGTYFLTFYVSDNSGNISPLFKVKIRVNENLTFLQNLNNSYIYLDTNECRSDDYFLETLTIDPTNYNSITTLENSYLLNYDTIGHYKIVYQIEHLDYTIEYLTLNIVTNENKKTITDHKEIKEKKETIFSQIISFITTILYKIGYFFKELFN